jgi:hypothetical protein
MAMFRTSGEGGAAPVVDLNAPTTLSAQQLQSYNLKPGVTVGEVRAAQSAYQLAQYQEMYGLPADSTLQDVLAYQQQAEAVRRNNG